MWRYLMVVSWACASPTCPEPAPTPEPTCGEETSLVATEGDATNDETFEERMAECVDPLHAPYRCPSTFDAAEAEHPAEILQARIHHCIRHPIGSVCRSSRARIEAACLAGQIDDACLAQAFILAGRSDSTECAELFHRHACREGSHVDGRECMNWDGADLPLITGRDAGEDCRAPILDEVRVLEPRSVDEAIAAVGHVTADSLAYFRLAEYLPEGAALAVDGSHALVPIMGDEATSRHVAFVDRRRSEELPIFTGREYHTLGSNPERVREHIAQVLRPRLIAIRDRLASRYRHMERITDADGSGFFEVRLREVSDSVVEVAIHEREGRRVWRRVFRFRSDEECISEAEAQAWWDPATRALLVWASRPSPDACDERELVLDQLPAWRP